MTATMTRPSRRPAGRLHPPRPRRPRPALSREDAATRLTAYVYGNIVTLAALVSLDRSAATSGQGFWIVLGAAATTYLAHLLADSIGRRVRSEHPLSSHDLLTGARGSVPVLTGAVLPVVMLAAAWLAHVPSLFAQVVGGGYLVVRLALTGATVARLRGAPSSLRIVGAGMGLAVLALVVVLLKVLVEH